MLQLIWPSIQTTKTFSRAAIRLFCSLIIHMFTGVAHLISFKNFSFPIHNLAVWSKRPHFQPISAFNMSFTLSFNISALWFKVRHVWLFTWTLGDHCQMVNWPNLIYLCLRNRDAWIERKRRVGQWNSQNIGIYLLSLPSYLSVIHVHHNTKDHWSEITIANIIMKRFEMLYGLPKCDRNTKWANAAGKMAPIHLLDARLPQTFNS